jgi:hypothetical protein
VSSFYQGGRQKAAFTIVKEGRQATVCKVEVAQMRARRDDGSQGGIVVVPLLKLERDGEGRERR